MATLDDLVAELTRLQAQVRELQRREQIGGFTAYAIPYGDTDGRLTQDTGTSWTPTFVGSGTAGTFTYSQQAGLYTRAGRLIHLHAYVGISGISVSPTGTLRIGGLPASARNVSSAFSALSIGWAYSLNTSNDNLRLIIEPNTAYLRVIEVTTAAGVTTSADAAASILQTGSQFIIGGTYLAE